MRHALLNSLPIVRSRKSPKIRACTPERELRLSLSEDVTASGQDNRQWALMGVGSRGRTGCAHRNSGVTASISRVRVIQHRGRKQAVRDCVFLAWTLSARNRLLPLETVCHLLRRTLGQARNRRRQSRSHIWPSLGPPRTGASTGRRRSNPPRQPRYCQVPGHLDAPRSHGSCRR